MMDKNPSFKLLNKHEKLQTANQEDVTGEKKHTQWCRKEDWKPGGYMQGEWLQNEQQVRQLAKETRCDREAATGQQWTKEQRIYLNETGIKQNIDT